jgi:type II secretion system protein E
VNLLIMQAVKERASDIHLEPGDEALRTRLRIDGVLQEVHGPTMALHPAIVSRVKVLAKLDIAEKRKPQDGRFQVKMDGREIDLRVSTVPTQYGEKIVMRLLDTSSILLTFEQLGLEEATRAQLERLIRSPHGIVLVTGPTGSGKTTTLYAALSVLNDVSRNIMTIEDPIEYHLAGINQVAVNPKADLTFASALRSFLRQDPNIIMVGEIRDRETAEIAIQAALTGHLVLSTLHTNDAPSSLTRLIDMGIEPFLIASSVVGVLAQRLVRVICPKCKESFQPSAAVAKELGLTNGSACFRGKGCPTCRQGGYKGRCGAFELLAMNDEIKAQVVAKASANKIREAARAAGMRSLREDGLLKVQAGVTTVEEVLRVTALE